MPARPVDSKPDSGVWLALARWVEGSRARRVAIVVIGIVVAQFALCGPSLLGKRILLPLELLGGPGIYLPSSVVAEGPHDPTRGDLVFQFEPERRFAAEELHAGRWPRWLPYEYGGVPMRFSVFSPLFLLKIATRSPVVLAWEQLAVALIAGLGAYVFFRRVLGLRFWPSALAAWCYPLSGFFVIWQGFPLPDTICWFPWLLTAAHQSYVRSSWWSVLALAIVTAILIVSGQPDVAALALLASAGAVFLTAIRAAAQTRDTLKSLLRTLPFAAAMGVGVLLAMPYVLPYVEYARQGERIGQRAAGQREERPPVGAASLPLVLWPDQQGVSREGSLFIGAGNQEESAAAAFAGVLALLLAAPMAWSSRRHRWANVLCTIAIAAGVGWCANVPGWVWLLRLPGLNLLSFNRLVFITGFALVVQAAIGINALCSGAKPHRAWGLPPLLLCLTLAAAAGARIAHLPEPIASQLSAKIASGQSVGWIRTADNVHAVQDWYTHSAAFTLALSVIAAVGWMILLVGSRVAKSLGVVLGMLILAEAVCFAHGRSAQTDPALYYPSIPSVSDTCRRVPGRVVGFFCLPANLAPMLGLDDVRGYDPVEPARMTELVRLAGDPASPVLSYTSMQSFAPAVFNGGPGDVRLSPVLDMLGVRYLICRGQPLRGVFPSFRGDDYWGVVNRRALPRVFVPQRVEVIGEPQARLRALANPEFDPRETAFVETAVAVPNNILGDARVAEEVPTRLVVETSMTTGGLLVLADRWDDGWRATLNGSAVPIYRTNHALRGVVVPSGASRIVFEYAPTSYRVGVYMALGGVLLLVVVGLLMGKSTRPATMAA